MNPEYVLLILVGLVFAAACWWANVRSAWKLLDLLTLFGVLLGGGAATAGMIALIAATF